MPRLIPLIWVFVVLSARTVARVLGGPLPLILPRLGPAAFFLALLATHGAANSLWAWACACAFVPPWVVATRWTAQVPGVTSTTMVSAR